MPEEKPSEKSEEKTVHKLMRNPNLPQIYINGMQVAIGYYEIRMTLLETSPSGANEATTKELISLIIPPECARGIADGMVKAVEQYEKEFGPLRPFPKDGVASVVV
ncbi:MAG TPA: DUF3467 domain-containing protein [Terriglobia bacterium]|nr:DUF3467 domain-containing protein [Terriglobia bacterium]